MDYVKIDGSFISDIIDDKVAYTMVKSINEIAHTMGLKTVAEYVSNENIVKKLNALKIDYIQGNHLHKAENISKISDINSIPLS